MLLIPCPHCGNRAEIEFQNGGEVIQRPADPSSLSDEQWADYLFDRDNGKGVVREHWWHLYGCQRWFVLERDTRSNEFQANRGQVW